MSDSPWAVEPQPGWTCLRLKHVCRFIGGGTPDTGTAEYWQGDIPWVSPKDMKTSRIRDAEDHISEEGLSASATRLVGAGAVLIVMRSGILRHSIPVAVSEVPTALNQDMKALLTDPRLLPEYLMRLVEGHQVELLKAWRKEGATVESLEFGLLCNTLIPIPPPEQQQAIADYLDRETERLDALIAAKERLLSLLAEKRQALITRAVTRGLDPNVPLRDSGIPWLGPIPAHWETVALRFLVDVMSGATPETGKSEYWDGEIPWVSPKDMKRDEIADSEDYVTEVALSDSALRLVPADAVLVVVRGMILAHSFPVALTMCEVTINQDMKALLCRPVIRPRYLRDFLRGVVRHVVSLVDASAHGTRKLETEILGRLQVCVPPINEQTEISEQVAEYTSELDRLFALTAETIALLKERRSALIAAAVTGQVSIPSEAVV